MLGREREWIVAHGDAEAPAEKIDRFESLCEERRTGLPVAYLTGSAFFYGREFVVNRRVLVPRPETEHLIDDAIAFIEGPMRVLDVGTGCGAIACTIAAETNAIVEATDSSPAAIEISLENARRLGLAGRCHFLVGDLADPVRGQRFDVVIANLPYVPTADLPKAPDPASYEPRGALDGGPDGLGLYRRLLPQLPPVLNAHTLLLLEAAPPTVSQLAKIVRSTLPDFVISVLPDYAGLARYIRAASPL